MSLVSIAMAQDLKMGKSTPVLPVKAAVRLCKTQGVFLA